jgi:hypothetical protein
MVKGISDPRSLPDPRPQSEVEGEGQGDPKPLARKRRQPLDNVTIHLNLRSLVFAIIRAVQRRGVIRGRNKVRAVSPEGSRSDSKRKGLNSPNQTVNCLS